MDRIIGRLPDPASSFAAQRLASSRRLTDADQPLGSAEILYRTLVEGSSELIILVDHDGCLSFANGACEELLGYERCEMLGRELSEFLALDAETWTELALAAPSRDQITVRRELAARRKDGTRIEVAFNATSVLEESTGDRGIVAVISDVSRRGHKPDT